MPESRYITLSRSQPERRVETPADDEGRPKVVSEPPEGIEVVGRERLHELVSSREPFLTVAAVAEDVRNVLGWDV